MLPNVHASPDKVIDSKTREINAKWIADFRDRSQRSNERTPPLDTTFEEPTSADAEAVRELRGIVDRHSRS